MPVDINRDQTILPLGEMREAYCAGLNCNLSIGYFMIGDNVTILQEEMNSLTTRNQELQAKLQQLRSDVQQMKNDTDAQLEKLQVEHQMLADKNKELLKRSEEASIQIILEEQDARERDNQTKDAQIADLRAQLTAKDRQIEILKQQLTRIQSGSAIVVSAASTTTTSRGTTTQQPVSAATTSSPEVGASHTIKMR